MENFYMVLVRTAHLARNQMRPYLAQIGLAQGQPRVLGYLKRNGPCCQRALAEHSEVDPATICRMLDTMEKSGFIARQNSEQDRRAGLVSITEKGLHAHEQWLAHCVEMEPSLLDGFTKQEKEQFAQFLLRAYRNLGGKLEREVQA